MSIESKGRKGVNRRNASITSGASTETRCNACGSKAAREEASYCQVCGKTLNEDYQPLDALRSSNRMQGKTFLVENAAKEVTPDLFKREENTISETAWACLVYSMVPYLGILFVPVTFVIGSFGIASSYKYPEAGGRKLALVSIILSGMVLFLQIFLWWLLYVIPKLANPGT